MDHYKQNISSNNEPYMARPTSIDLNPIKLHYYTFLASLDRCDGSCNTFEDRFDTMCVPNKTR